MDDQDLTNALRQIGLTEKEIDTYFVILDAGETIVSAVADEAGVSKRHVYNIAGRLEERSLIEMNDFVVPTRLRAIPPEDVKRRLVTDANELYDMLNTQYERPELDLQRLEVLKSRSTLIKRIQQIVQTANEQVTIAIPPSLIPSLEEHLSEAIDRNVLVLLLLLNETVETITAQDIDIEGLAHAVRVHRREMAIQVAVDNNFGLIAPHDLLFNEGNMTQALAIGDPHLEPVISAAFFGEQWAFSDEIHVSSPDVLPNTYLSFRLAVVQAALHSKQGKDIYAKVKAYPKTDQNRSQPPEIVEGEVIEVNQRMIEPEIQLPIANLVLKTESSEVSIGTRRCIYEDYEAIRTQLELV
jgi:HTH-type transcriptional regulator, sugar sensing transcriptional regulator